MKRIETPEEKERKRKRNTAVISTFLLAILLFGTIGFGFVFSPGSTDEPDELPDGLNNINGQWILKQDEQIFYFTTNPESVKDTPVTIENTLQAYSGQSLYIVSNNTPALQLLASNLNRFSPKIQQACLGSCEEDFPEKNCSESLIVFKETEEKKVYQEDKCVFIEGDLTSVDALIYKLFGY